MSIGLIRRWGLRNVAALLTDGAAARPTGSNTKVQWTSFLECRIVLL
jgi:hypothetical protein